jgi:hypothetical protein
MKIQINRAPLQEHRDYRMATVRIGVGRTRISYN